jgi:hypothetical protein
VGGEKLNFEKCFCFDGENMLNIACYYTEDKLKLSDDVALLKKLIILNKY